MSKSHGVAQPSETISTNTSSSGDSLAALPPSSSLQIHVRVRPVSQRELLLEGEEGSAQTPSLSSLCFDQNGPSASSSSSSLYFKQLVVSQAPSIEALLEGKKDPAERQQQQPVQEEKILPFEFDSVYSRTAVPSSTPRSPPPSNATTSTTTDGQDDSSYCDVAIIKAEESHDLFLRVGKPLVDGMLQEGTNGTVFTYGTSGSGKWDTLFGPSWRKDGEVFPPSEKVRKRVSTLAGEPISEIGLVPRCIDYLFASLQNRTRKDEIDFIEKHLMMKEASSSPSFADSGRERHQAIDNREGISSPQQSSASLSLLDFQTGCLELAVVAIHREEIGDLLLEEEWKHSSKGKKIRVQPGFAGDPAVLLATHCHEVPGLTWLPVSSSEEAKELISGRALRNRFMTAMRMNYSISHWKDTVVVMVRRSHYWSQRERTAPTTHTTSSPTPTTSSGDYSSLPLCSSSNFHFEKLEFHTGLNFILNPGCERISKAGATGEELKEGVSVNMGLTSPAQVLHSLFAQNSKFIPYRNSKLTYLLQPSLQKERCQIHFIGHVSPHNTESSDTLSTLRFCSRLYEDKERHLREEERLLQKGLEATAQARAPRRPNRRMGFNFFGARKVGRTRDSADPERFLVGLNSIESFCNCGVIRASSELSSGTTLRDEKSLCSLRRYEALGEIELDLFHPASSSRSPMRALLGKEGEQQEEGKFDAEGIISFSQRQLRSLFTAWVPYSHPSSSSTTSNTPTTLLLPAVFHYPPRYAMTVMAWQQHFPQVVSLQLNFFRTLIHSWHSPSNSGRRGVLFERSIEFGYAPRFIAGEEQSPLSKMLLVIPRDLGNLLLHGQVDLLWTLIEKFFLIVATDSLEPSQVYISRLVDEFAQNTERTLRSVLSRETPGEGNKRKTVGYLFLAAARLGQTPSFCRKLLSTFPEICRSALGKFPGPMSGLEIAAQFGHFETVKAILSCSNDVAAAVPGGHSFSSASPSQLALYCASWRGSEQIVRLLLDQDPCLDPREEVSDDYHSHYSGGSSSQQQRSGHGGSSAAVGGGYFDRILLNTLGVNPKQQRQSEGVNTLGVNPFKQQRQSEGNEGEDRSDEDDGQVNGKTEDAPTPLGMSGLEIPHSCGAGVGGGIKPWPPKPEAPTPLSVAYYQSGEPRVVLLLLQRIISLEVVK